MKRSTRTLGEIPGAYYGLMKRLRAKPEPEPRASFRACAFSVVLIMAAIALAKYMVELLTK